MANQPQLSPAVPVPAPYDEVTPPWYNQMVAKYLAGIHQFILDDNVRDLVFVPAGNDAVAPPFAVTPALPPPGNTKAWPSLPLSRVARWLCRRWLDKFDMVLVYSLTTGLYVYEQGQGVDDPHLMDLNPILNQKLREGQPASAELFTAVSNIAIERPFPLRAVLERTVSNDNIRHSPTPEFAMRFLDRMLTQPFELPGLKAGMPRTPVRIALLMDYVEHLAPDSASEGTAARDLTMMVEALARWALDEDVTQSGHLIVLLTENIHRVAPKLYNQASGVQRLTLKRPGAPERLAFLQWLAAGSRLSTEQDLGRLSTLSAGFNYSDIVGLAAEAWVGTGQVIAERQISAAKTELIRNQSNGILEVVEPAFGWEQVGGLKHVIEALKEVSGWLKSPQLAPRLAPKGMLFVGPPGTGKSLVAQALAKESGLNMVKLRDVQSGLVGASERNMSRALDVASAFAPIILFTDEVDQAYGQRGGYQGDSGVTARLFGKLLEFTGDNRNRGRVVWIAASNRPDLIDAALLRRFDRVVPFLLPGREERRRIFLDAMPEIAHFQWLDGPQDNQWTRAHQQDLEEVLNATGEFSGSELEKVARRAVELSGGDGETVDPACLLAAVEDFRQNHDRRAYLLQTLLALSATDFRQFLPEDLGALPNFIISVDAQTQRQHINWAVVERLIRDLQRGIEPPELVGM